MHAAPGTRSPLRALLCGALFAAATCPAHADAPPAPWSYSGATGPAQWGKEDSAYATCELGHQQSPIDIREATPAALPPIEFNYQPVPLVVTDTHHSFQVNDPPGNGGIAIGADHYDLVQFHFHRPSEESIHGQHYEMVIHLVHKNDKGQLAVVAVLIRRGEANRALKKVFDHFPPEGQTQTPVPGVTLDPSQLLPALRGYYSFDGSLTTPPCSEQVRWLVLKQPIHASAEQIAQFAARYPNNARPTQPLNDRKIQQTRD
jgi:carbonic anhydrase